MKTQFSPIAVRASGHLLVAWVLALVAALALSLTGLGHEVERQLGNLRAAILEKPASGEIVLVEIDAKSLQTMDNWPWPRGNYAKAITALNSAGVTQIAFDVDFSSRSTDVQDNIFADAIADADATIILPTMRQRASNTEAEFIESLPIEILRQNAFLASVNVHPDSHGQLNTYSFGTITGGVARPSLASMLAEVSGDIGKSFPIDQSIDPATIPRFSFVDVMRSDFPARQLNGKKVLIGATAIELGDRYPISRYGILPGVVIQAMASETLIQGSNLRNFGGLPSIIFSAIFLLACILTRKFSSSAMIRIAFATASVLFLSLLFFEYQSLATFTNMTAYLFLLSYAVMQKFLTTAKALKTSKYVQNISGLPNEAALLEAIGTENTGFIATARIEDFRELMVVTDHLSRPELFSNMADRLMFLALDERVYHLESDLIAWIVKDEYTNDIGGHFDTASVLLQSPIMAGGTRIKVGAAFGISKESLDKSKIASEQAFVTGKKWTWHDEEVDRAIGEKRNLLLELDQSIEDGDLGVVYQPKWDLKQNCLNGAEALVRWSHPQRGMISPEIFIPLLERAGRIDQLTAFVLGQALENLARWGEYRSGLTCSVNISAKLLGDSSFVDNAVAMVNDSPVSNEQVVFEVTETATLADPDVAVAALNLIQDTGIRISIDDYGTGQSTMSYLQRLPVSEIKLDQSFVKTMVSDNANRVMVKSTIKMAHALGFKIVAEGIEDQQCMALLTRFGCDIGQGWHISKPISSSAFIEDWLTSEVGQVRLSA